MIMFDNVDVLAVSLLLFDYVDVLVVSLWLPLSMTWKL